MNDLRFVLRITMIDDPKDYLIINRDGTIEGITQHLASCLELKFESLNMKIWNICDKFRESQTPKTSQQSDLRAHPIVSESNSRKSAWNLLMTMKEEVLTFSNGSNEIVCDANVQMKAFYGIDYFQMGLIIRDKNPLTTRSNSHSFALVVGDEMEDKRLSTVIQKEKIKSNSSKENAKPLPTLRKLKNKELYKQELSSTGSRSTKSEKSKLEGAIYGEEKRSLLEVALSIRALVFITLCCTFMIVIYLFREYNIDLALWNANILRHDTLAIFNSIRLLTCAGGLERLLIEDCIVMIGLPGWFLSIMILCVKR